MCGRNPDGATTTAPAPQASVVAEATSAPVVVPASLGDWQARVVDGKLLLEGKVASQQAKDQILAAAQNAFGAGNVTDQLTIEGALPAFQGGGALADLFAWLKNNTSVTLQAAGNRLAFAGALGEALIGDLAHKIKGWFGDSVLLDTSRIEAQLMKAADAFKQGIKTFRVNVEFDTAKATLRDASKAELDELADALKAAGTGGEVAGHTDNVGDAADNLTLSQQRADAVKAYLVQRGVDAAQLTAKGYGMEQPIADNATEAGRQRNRRVQFHAQ
ncbi:MAG: OmpA family protein [Brachymonas sp.]|nr:OmpA family protein [Brachymonas sp.]